MEARRNVTIAGLSGNVQEAMQNVVRDFSVDGSAVVPRREVVDQANCASCHGVFSQGFSIHGNLRNRVEYCVLCHNPSMTDFARRVGVSGADPDTQPIGLKHMLHKIHTGEELTQQPYVIYGFNGSVNDFGEVLFPGNRANCEGCHLPETFLLPLPPGLLPTLLTTIVGGVNTTVGIDPADPGCLPLLPRRCGHRGACRDEHAPPGVPKRVLSATARAGSSPSRRSTRTRCSERSRWRAGPRTQVPGGWVGMIVLLAGVSGRWPGTAAAQTVPPPDAGVCGSCHYDLALAYTFPAGHAAALDCIACHGDRRPGRVGRRHRSILDCANCHDAVHAHPAKVANRQGRRQTRTCLNCHDPHGTPNLSLVRDLVHWRRRLYDVSFTVEGGLTPGGLASPTDPGSGMCEVCHRTTEFYPASGHGDPHFGENCPACHDHTAAFAPVATDQNCMLCHQDEAARHAMPSGHADKTCATCHAEISPTPGPGHRAVEACQTCHPATQTARAGRHGAALHAVSRPARLAQHQPRP